MRKGNKIYKRLEVDFELPDYLEEEIEAFLNHINNENGLSEDCYRVEIQLMIRDTPSFTAEQKQLLYNYYARGGIYE